MLRRSLSLIRRYPSPESIDLTFATAEMEERLRVWVDENLTIKYVLLTAPLLYTARRMQCGTTRGNLPPRLLFAVKVALFDFYLAFRMTLC